jgi:AcrR family transcriptional regulator
MGAAKPRRRLPTEERRAEIVDAAEKQIRKLGANCRVEDVVSAAGAAKGTFYLYFPSWEDLLLTLRGRVVERFQADFVMDGEYDARAWPKQIETVCINFVRFILDLEGLHEVLFHGPLRSDVDSRAQSAASDWLKELLLRARRGGAVKGLDLEATARMLFAIIHSTADAIEHGANASKQEAALRTVIRRILG